ncbi:MAG TPA: UDP-N-acetylmuramate dehydrogenase [Candidatus Limnocylindrales bacterium]
MNRATGGSADPIASSPAIEWAGAAEDVSRRAGVPLLRNESLAGHTTMRVGGPADFLATAADSRVLSALVVAARAVGLPHVILGRGSDILVSDRGVRGLVILSCAEGYSIDGPRLTAAAGLPLARASTIAQKEGLSGLEFGLAIPGSVGGAVWANAGAHGADVAGVLESVTVLGPDGAETTRPVADLAMSYRDSHFKRADEVILSATFRLAPADPEIIKARLDEIRAWRREHQPLSLPSAGSVFRNPPGDSAGRLIDACGLRGAKLGGAAISEKHANFVVNGGGATAADLRRLGDRARAAVSARFDIMLEYEIQFVGDWDGWPEASA